eukprot:4326892-Prymnesium_polylepis.1
MADAKGRKAGRRMGVPGIQLPPGIGGRSAANSGSRSAKYVSGDDDGRSAKGATTPPQEEEDAFDTGFLPGVHRAKPAAPAPAALDGRTWFYAGADKQQRQATAAEL